MIKKYKAKPVVVEAMQVTIRNLFWFTKLDQTSKWDPPLNELNIGDYLIKSDIWERDAVYEDKKGNLYIPVKKEIFESKYEEVK